MKLGLIISALVLVPLLFIVSNYITFANYGNATEKKLEAMLEANQNILAQYGQKIAESAQVPTMMKDDVKEVVTAAITGRYGAEGSKAVFQMITEQNPTVSAELYVQIQRIIESGRNEFQLAQNEMVDVKRQYRTQLDNVWSGFWLKLAGYPELDLEKIKPVTTERATEAFKTGKEEPIKLR